MINNTNKIKTKNFEDIVSWKKSQELSVYIYSILRQNKDFSFKDQIQEPLLVLVTILRKVLTEEEIKS